MEFLLENNWFEKMSLSGFDPTTCVIWVQKQMYLLYVCVCNCNKNVEMLGYVCKGESTTAHFKDGLVQFYDGLKMIVWEKGQ